jgi:hypothetical protein
VIRGLLLGVIGLAGLQVLVSNPRAYGSLGALGTILAGGVHAFLSPGVPAIPDKRQKGAKT